MPHKRSGLFLLAVVLALCLGVGLLETQTRIIRRAVDDTLYDNRNHYLPCEKLPDESETRQVVAEHQKIIQRIRQVDPGQVGVEIDAATCPGKADLLIWYPSHPDRLAIEDILAGAETFYGIPYRLQNR